MSEAANAVDLPASVQLVTGPGDLPMLQVRDAQVGELDVFLHGAHVTHWVPAGQAPVLWLSSTSKFSPDAAIRGGVPICFPWFGAGASDDLKPSHGPARVSAWRLLSASQDADGIQIALGLETGPESEADGASGLRGTGALAATMRIGMGSALDLTLEVRNEGPSSATYEAALHTYLAVGDVHDVGVEGLGGANYIDRLGGPEPVVQTDDVIRFSGETDRIYLGNEADVVIDDPGLGRRLAVRKAGSASTVVWTPWVEKAAGMADLDGWESMLCVETANVRSDAITIAPGESHAMTATYEVLPR